MWLCAGVVARAESAWPAGQALGAVGFLLRTLGYDGNSRGRGRGAGLQQCTQLSFGEGSGTRSSGGHGRFLGHAVWLSGDCAVAIVSVVRTGMAWSSLGCWLFILSAVAWPEVGVRSESR